MATSRVATALAASAILAAPVSTLGQPALQPSATGAPAPITGPAAAPAPAAAPTPVVAVPAPARLRLREGTEVHLTLDEPLSSKTAAEGDRFKITVAEPITLDD